MTVLGVGSEGSQLRLQRHENTIAWITAVTAAIPNGILAKDSITDLKGTAGTSAPSCWLQHTLQIRWWSTEWVQGLFSTAQKPQCFAIPKALPTPRLCFAWAKNTLIQPDDNKENERSCEDRKAMDRRQNRLVCREKECSTETLEEEGEKSRWKENNKRNKILWIKGKINGRENIMKNQAQNGSEEEKACAMKSD